MMTVEEAIALARRYHEGVTDKGGRPYIEHPLRVMNRVSTVEEKLTAVMHDLLEDTSLTPADLAAAGCPARVLQALDALTKRDGEQYEAFVARAAADPLARAVKLADIADNSDPERLAVLPPDDAARLQAKYAGARAIVDATVPVEPDAPLYGIGENDPSEPGPYANFDCAVCGHPAGRVEFQGSKVVITGPLGRAVCRVERPQAATVKTAVLASDAATLRRFEFTPFWCPTCPASYCHRHWATEMEFDEGFYDCTYGTCPEGHRTMLDD